MGFLTHSGPVTAAEGRRQRKKLIASMARDLRKKDRQHLAKLRAAIKAKRVEKKEKIETIRTLCRTGLVAARERAKERYAALRERQKTERVELREQTREEREAARNVCSTKPEIAAAAKAEVAQAREVYEGERARIREEHQSSYHKPPTMTRGEAARARAESRAESDDEVRNDIPPELAPVWEKVKRTIQATPRMSRTEAFLHWVHDNSATVERLIDESVTEQLAALEREEKEHAREIRKSSRYKRGPEHLAADLDIDADEYREGAERARRDMADEAWTVERARAYMANILPATSSYARGYDDAINELATRAPGTTSAAASAPQPGDWVVMVGRRFVGKEGRYTKSQRRAVTFEDRGSAEAYASDIDNARAIEIHGRAPTKRAKRSKYTVARLSETGDWTVFAGRKPVRSETGTILRFPNEAAAQHHLDAINANKAGGAPRPSAAEPPRGIFPDEPAPAPVVHDKTLRGIFPDEDEPDDDMPKRSRPSSFGGLPSSSEILQLAEAEMDQQRHGSRTLRLARELVFAVADGMPPGAARSTLEARFLTALREYQAEEAPIEAQRAARRAARERAAEEVPF